MNTTEHITWHHHPFLTFVHQPHHPPSCPPSPPSPIPSSYRHPYRQLAHPLGLRCSTGLPAHNSPDQTSHEQGCLLQHSSLPPPRSNPGWGGAGVGRLESGPPGVHSVQSRVPSQERLVLEWGPMSVRDISTKPIQRALHRNSRTGASQRSLQGAAAQCCLRTWAQSPGRLHHATRQPLSSLKGVGGA